jgi:hypothetical protein
MEVTIRKQNGENGAGIDRIINNAEYRGGTVINTNTVAALYEDIEEWDRLYLNVKITIADPDKINEVVISRETPLTGHLEFKANEVRLRSGKIVKIKSDHSFMAETMFYKSDLAGELIIIPSVILDSEIKDNIGYAWHRGSRIITGYPVSIYIDKPTLVFGSGLEIRWQSFPDEFSESLCHLEILADKPTLFINSRHTSLKYIYDSVGATGSKAALRKVLFADIAVSVWMILLEYAGPLMEDDDNGDQPDILLAQRILRTAARGIHRKEEDLIEIIKSPERLRILSRLLQHWLKVGVEQNKFIGNYQPESVENIQEERN